MSQDLTPEKIEEMRNVMRDRDKIFTPHLICPLVPPDTWYLLEKKTM